MISVYGGRYVLNTLASTSQRYMWLIYCLLLDGCCNVFSSCWHALYAESHMFPEQHIVPYLDCQVVGPYKVVNLSVTHLQRNTYICIATNSGRRLP